LLISLSICSITYLFVPYGLLISQPVFDCSEKGGVQAGSYTVALEEKIIFLQLYLSIISTRFPVAATLFSQ